ncbi:protein misato homolog 1-like [Paramacrobiotus metropolitanus]|uniref:protein misato homolog 1-like n=1 Tax=Paramacrobiotus metropolitanus TaxID=2943436 RepID=UPI0024458ADB|nr:protein misato homolog 1-like [Paramacrobiotus metropolitanus]
MPKELLTLQCGHYANFVGTHFWNLQEAGFSYNPQQPTSKEIDVGVLHREGETLRGEPTFTPRLVLCDLKGSLNSLQANGGLYDDGYHEKTNSESLSWNGPVTALKINDVKPNKYIEEVRKLQKAVPVVENEIPKRPRQADYQLEESVSTWSDFLGVLLHPRSIVSLKNYWLDDAPSFELYGLGLEEYKQAAVREPLENSIRYFVEESDNLQGFQLLLDADDGFSGFTAALLDHLADDYQSKPILMYPLIPTPVLPAEIDPRKDFYRLFNLALTLAGSSDDNNSHCLSVPLSVTAKLTRPKQYLDQLPYVRFQPIAYHTSAILAGAVDSISVLSRLSSDELVPLRDIISATTIHQRKVAAMSTMIPFPLRATDSLFSSLKAIDAEYLPVSSLTPHVTTPLIDSQNRCYSQVMSLRGIPQERWKCSTEEIQYHRLSYEVASMPASRLLENFMQSYCPNTFGVGRVMEFPCHTRVPFPQFFSSEVSENGFLQSNHKRLEDVQKLPIFAGIHSTDKVTDLLTELKDACSKENMAKYFKVVDSGLECDEFKESFERLESLSGRYREC